jgi:hypothetical protein
VKHFSTHFSADDRGYARLNHSVILNAFLNLKFGMTHVFALLKLKPEFPEGLATGKTVQRRPNLIES